MPELAIVAIDPSASSHGGSDECGFVSVALGRDDHWSNGKETKKGQRVTGPLVT
jgi:phage terminase large subunit-like protein